MNHYLEPIATVQRAVWGQRFPEDIAREVQDALRVFHADPTLFDAPGLEGPAKRAELVVKLGYWLVLGHLAAEEFRAAAERLPDTGNAGWDVDLRPRQPRSVLPHVLKLERTAPAEAAPRLAEQS